MAPRGRGNRVTKPRAGPGRRNNRQNAADTSVSSPTPRSFNPVNVATAYTTPIATPTMAFGGFGTGIHNNVDISEPMNPGFDGKSPPSTLPAAISLTYLPVAPSTFNPFADQHGLFHPSGPWTSNDSFSSASSSCYPDPCIADESFSQQSYVPTTPASSFSTSAVSQDQAAHLFTPVEPSLALQKKESPVSDKTKATAGQKALEWYGNDIHIDSASHKRLAEKEAMRDPIPRRKDHTMNLERRSNVEAVLSYIAGEESPHPCKSCSKGHGPWKTCVVMEGSLCGACTNCWFNASGSRCQFHEGNKGSVCNAPQAVTAPAAQPTPAPQVMGDLQLPSFVTQLMQLPGSMGPETDGLSAHSLAFVRSSMGAVAGFGPRGRHLSRIQSAA